MSPLQKSAFRRLLYLAMVDIRNLCQSRGRAGWNPFEWRRQFLRSRIAGALADWLHNLAQFSAMDFDRFDEQWFWTEHSSLVQRFPDQRLERYREWFDQSLTDHYAA